MPVAAVVGGAVLGGVAGGQKDKTTQTSTSGTTNELRIDEAGKQEKAASDLAYNASFDLDARLKALESSPVLANLDKLLAELGSGPSAERIASANELANNVFAPQQTALNQSFEDQTRNFAARAAQQGRSSSDPILAAKLAQEQIRQNAALNAQKGSFAAQEAVNAPARQFENQLGGLTGLSNQAIQNRQAVFALGSQFANTQMQYRLATASRLSTTNSAGDQQSGGGFKGALTGFLGGGAAGAKAFAGGA